MEANNRRHLANMRVVQKNLVYVIGLGSRLSTEEVFASIAALNELKGGWTRLSFLENFSV